MNLFAMATIAAAQSAGMGGLVSLLPFLLIIVVMYFIMIRPQKKKEKLKQQMLSQLIVGDKILTIGGIHGKIVSIKDDMLVLETGGTTADEKSYVKISRWAVGEVTKPGDEVKASKNEIAEKSEDKKSKDK